MSASSSASFSGCTAPTITRGPGWAWLSCSESSSVTAAEFGPMRNPTRARPFPSLLDEEVFMLDHGLEILLVEDNPNDEMLALHAFKRQKIVNDVHVVRDGAEALEYIFCTGAYADRRIENPKLILLDLKLPKVDGIEVLRQIRSD